MSFESFESFEQGRPFLVQINLTRCNDIPSKHNFCQSQTASSEKKFPSFALAGVLQLGTLQTVDCTAHFPSFRGR